MKNTKARSGHLAILLGVILLNLSVSHVNAEIERFFAKPEMISAYLNPNGKFVASVIGGDERQQLTLINAETASRSVLLSLSDIAGSESSFNSMAWIDNVTLAVQFIEQREGIKNLLDTRRKSQLLILRLVDNQVSRILSVRTKGWLADPLPEEPGKFLYAKNGVHSKLYKVSVDKLTDHGEKLDKLMKVDGGQFIKDNEVASVKGAALRWFINTVGEPKAVMHYTEKTDVALTAFNHDGSQEELKKWEASEETIGLNGEGNSDEKLLVPVAMADSDSSFYCIDYAEEEEKTVYKANYETKEEILIYESDSFRIVDIILSYPDRKFIGVEVLKDGRLSSVYTDQFVGGSKSVGNKNYAALSSLLSYRGGTSLFYSESHSQPGVYSVVIKDSATKKVIGAVFPKLVNYQNSRLESSTIDVEGMSIPYFLSLPQRVNKDDVYPLVVMPHGGPIGVFDHPYFDVPTQFLVANGYAVLRVNYRGSSGYSSELKEAGKKQWGKLILEDIYQATKRVVKRVDIDSGRVSVVGFSYGGYASTMLTIKYPELYKSAANISGVSDVNLYLNRSRLTPHQHDWLKEYVGDSKNEYDELKAISPVYSAHKLTRPYLIVHGERDRVVDVEHAHRLKLVLEKNNIPFYWHTLPESGHHFESTEESVEVFSVILDFLQKHL